MGQAVDLSEAENHLVHPQPEDVATVNTAPSDEFHYPVGTLGGSPLITQSAQI